MTTSTKKKMTAAWNKLTPAEALAELAQLEEARAQATLLVDQLVLLLRSPDLDGFCPCSWSEIADALGVTRQAAQQRYGRRGL